MGFRVSTLYAYVLYKKGSRKRIIQKICMSRKIGNKNVHVVPSFITTTTDTKILGFLFKQNATLWLQIWNQFEH